MAQGDSTAASAVVAKSIADATTMAAAQKLAEVVLSQSAIQSMGTSFAALFSGRRLLDVSSVPRLAVQPCYSIQQQLSPASGFQLLCMLPVGPFLSATSRASSRTLLQALRLRHAGGLPHQLSMQAQKLQSDGSLPDLVHDAVSDPATQAALAHVMEAAATESKAIKDISGPASAPSPGVGSRPLLTWHPFTRFPPLHALPPGHVLKRRPQSSSAKGLSGTLFRSSSVPIDLRQCSSKMHQ